MADGAAELNRQIELEKARPWWKKGVPVATLTAIVASVAPSTTAVWGAFQNTTEKELQRMKLKHSVQMDYLKIISIDAASDTARQRMLRMIVSTDDDPRIVAWAKEENAGLEQTIKTIKDHIDDRHQDASAAPSAQPGFDRAVKEKQLQKPQRTTSPQTVPQTETTRQKDPATPGLCAERYYDCARLFTSTVCSSAYSRCLEAVTPSADLPAVTP